MAIYAVQEGITTILTVVAHNEPSELHIPVAASVAFRTEDTQMPVIGAGGVIAAPLAAI